MNKKTLKISALIGGIFFLIGATGYFVFARTPTQESEITSPQPSVIPNPIDKFALWQKPSFFRGAAVHPYLPYVQQENSVYLTKQDLQDLRSQGANIVSLNYPGPFRPLLPYTLDQEALKYLDDAVKWSEEVGLYVIIHFRNGPGKSEDTFGSGEWKSDETLWYSEEEKTKWIEMWQFVAQRYQNRSHVIAYNLMVEPHPEDPVQQEPLKADVWNDLAKSITAAIRNIDNETPIIIGATWWSNPIGFSDLKPTGDSRTIYSFHMYEPFDFTHQGFEWAGKGDVSGLIYPGMIPSDVYEETRYWDKSLLEEFLEPVLAFQRKNNVPIFVGEFGCNRKVPSCVTYLGDLLSLFEDKGWSYTYFVWRDIGDFDGDFDYEQEPTGDKRVKESTYMKLFKKSWSKNKYFEKNNSTKAPLTTVTLKELAAARGIRMGGNYDYELRSETHDKIFEQEFNAMTAGIFWTDGSRKSRKEFDFSEMDAKVSWARAHGMELHGHILVWFDEMPDWVKAAPMADVEAIMNEHIDTVVGRYAGKIKVWDVVNEAVSDDGTLRQDHKWAEAMGIDYIRKAFIRAHAADPTAVLRYNEYDIESNQAKFDGVKALLLSLKNQGVPVHALGWQMHVKPGSFDPTTLLARFNEIADMGLDNYITELDVELPSAPTAAAYENQEQTYKTVVETFLAARRHKTLVVWGLRDGSPYWLTNGHPLLFDESFRKKPAYFGVQEALK